MKKIILFILCGIELLSLLCIYLIGGMAGVYAWNINIFIVAPIALIAGIVQIVIIIIRLFQKKKVKINIIFAIVSIVLAYPVTILLGVSNITYPTKDITENTNNITAILIFSCFLSKIFDAINFCK